MLSLFSLLYGDALETMGHRTQGAAIVLSTMLFVTNFGGPIAGAIVKLSSPRLVAVVGACSCTLGIFFSGFSTNIYHLILTYGVLLGKIYLFYRYCYFKFSEANIINVSKSAADHLIHQIMKSIFHRFGQSYHIYIICLIKIRQMDKNYVFFDISSIIKKETCVFYHAQSKEW